MSPAGFELNILSKNHFSYCLKFRAYERNSTTILMMMMMIIIIIIIIIIVDVLCIGMVQ
jgi:hypothetical protein